MDSDWQPDQHAHQKRAQRSHKAKRKRGRPESESSRKSQKLSCEQKPRTGTRIRLSSAKKLSLLQEFDGLEGPKHARLNSFSSSHPSVTPRTFRRWRVGSNRASIEASAHSKSSRVQRARVSAGALGALSCARFPAQEKAVHSLYKERRQQSRGCSTWWFQSKMASTVKSDHVN